MTANEVRLIFLLGVVAIVLILLLISGINILWCTHKIKICDRNIAWLEREMELRPKANEMVFRWRLVRSFINGPEVDGYCEDWYKELLKPIADKPVEYKTVADIWKNEHDYKAVAAYLEAYSDVMEKIEKAMKEEGIWPIAEDDGLWD
jgi:hypothetical protein